MEKKTKVIIYRDKILHIIDIVEWNKQRSTYKLKNCISATAKQVEVNTSLFTSIKFMYNTPSIQKILEELYSVY